MLGAFTIGHHAHGYRSNSLAAATRLLAAAVAPATLSPRGGDKTALAASARLLLAATFQDEGAGGVISASAKL
jgi:hypothetical protein